MLPFIQRFRKPPGPLPKMQCKVLGTISSRSPKKILKIIHEEHGALSSSLKKKKKQFLVHLSFRGQDTGKKKLEVSYVDKRHDSLSQVFILLNEVYAQQNPVNLSSVLGDVV